MKVEPTPGSPGTAAGGRNRQRRRGRWLVTAALVLILVIVVSWLLTSRRVFHVVPGEVLRSRQLDPEELRKVIRDEHLQTVISLRSDQSLQWLHAEREVCSNLGVYHAALRFSPDEWPARHEVRRLLELLETAKTPILLHCYRGVDRAGWASAMTLVLTGKPLDEAMIQLSPRYGHVCDRDTCPLHFFFNSYREHLTRRALAGGGEDFRLWVTEDYCPEPYNARLDLLTELPEQSAPGEVVRTSVHAVNQGSFSWRMTDLKTTGVRLGARVLGPFDQAPKNPIHIFRIPAGPAVDVARSGLESGVMPPGAERDFELRFTAPQTPGVYLLQIDMVDELVHWFSDLGFPGLIHELTVVEPTADAG